MSKLTPPPWLDAKAYPFQSRYASTPAGMMHYIDEGAGAPVVFVHGNPAWSFLYRQVIPRLSSSCRCLAPDHIGFGLSDKPADWSYLAHEHARLFEQWLESLDVDGITLVVGDWGGPIGLSYAVAHPDKVKSLVITNSWMWPVDRDWYYRAFSGFMGGPVGRFLIRRFNFFVNTVMKASFGDSSRLTPDIHRQYVQPLAHPADRKGCWVFPGEIVAATDWLKALWEKREALADKPMLIAWGMKDIAFRQKELDRWIASFPSAKVVRYSDAGHFVAEEKPVELAAEIAALLASERNGAAEVSFGGVFSSRTQTNP